ncbi:NNT [Symbiodinium necroappetens]|uniref:NNT protein n=1 Tax=Symbiodinium necroappetens TaxID=1628268 RepID=A0A812YY11_9DINO|nr:NNT [Symbiodinium necroappetens]
MPTPLGPCGPAGAATSWDWHRESALVAKDPGASHLGRASSVYTAWCQMKELCTVKTSEVFDASSSAFAMFFPPLPKEPDATLAGDAPKEARDQMPDLRLATPLLDENLRGYGSMPGIPMSFTLSEYCAREPPFSPASTVSYGRQAPVSPAATEYCYGRQAPVSPASTHYFYATDAPDSPASTTYIFGREAPSSPASTVCDYQTFEAPLPEYDGREALTEVLSPKKFPTHPNWRHFSEDRSQARNNFGEHCPSQWCGLFNSCCPDAVPESCSRCQQALGSFFDHHCPKCSQAVCVSCIETLNYQTFRCSCGDELSNQPMIARAQWMFGVCRSTMQAFDFITGTNLAGPSHAVAPVIPESYTEMPSPAAPLPSSLPSILGHRPRVSQSTEVFKTNLPGEMPCSPVARRWARAGVNKKKARRSSYELRQRCVLP